MSQFQPLTAAVRLDESGQRNYESLVAERMPGTDTATWALFTYVLGAGRRAEAFLSEIVRRHDLDGAQFSVLVVLWMNPAPHRLSPTTLSRFIAQSPSGMTHTVKRLTAAGLVSRVGLESDGRAKHVELTEKGIETVTACAGELAKALEDLFDHDEVDDLAGSQRRIVNALTARLDT